MTTENNVSDQSPLGVSVHHLCTTFQPETMLYAGKRNANDFSTKIKMYDMEDFIYEKGEHYRSREDNRMKSSYVDSLDGKDHVGPASYMLSYSRENTINDIVNALVGFCKSRRFRLKRTYVLIWCLCTNHHRIRERMDRGENVPFDKTNFEEKIVGIKDMLSLMVPWNAPLNLKRVWCLYETYTAIEKKCNLTMIMPPVEKEKLMCAIMTVGANNLLEVLSSTKIEDAEASRQEDKENIMSLINSGPGNSSVDSKVNNRLKEWIGEAMVETAKTAESNAEDVVRNVDLAILYNGIGGVYNEKGDYEEALEYYMKCLKIIQEVYGSNHPKKAFIYNNIGNVYNKKNEKDQALECFEESLLIRKKAFGPDHHITADIYNNIGNVYIDKRDYNKALEYFGKCLPICAKANRANSPETALVYYNIGVAYRKKGDYNNALDYFLKCLPIREEVYGADNSETAHTYNNIGIVYKKTGNFEEALKYSEKCSKIYAKVYGPNHPKTANTYYNVGIIYYNKNNYKQALKFYMKCLAIYKKVYGSEYPVTADTYYNIGNVHRKEGNYDKTLINYKKCMTTREKILGKDHIKTAETYYNIGAVYRKKDEYGKALKYLKKCLPIYEKKYGTDHQETMKTKETISELYEEKATCSPYAGLAP